MNLGREHIRVSQWPRMALATVVILGVSFLFLFPTYWLYVIGAMHSTEETLYPFLDMHGRLAAFEAHRSGIDILYEPNPIDPLQRVNVKPTWPLGLSFLGLGPQHLIAAGTIAVCLLGCVVFSLLKPRRWLEAFILMLLCFSPPVLLAIERGNDDIVYFCILALVPLCLKLKGSYRFWLAWLVIFMLAPAKYYPGAVFAVFFLEVKHWRQLAALLMAGVLFVACYLVNNIEEVLYLKESVPKPNFFMVHGGSLAFEVLGLAGTWARLPLMVCVGLGLWVIARPRAILLPPALSLETARWFVLGYSVFAFCFIFNSNFDYRLIYILPMLPLLLLLAGGESTASKWKLLAGVLILMLIPTFWGEIGLMHYFIVTQGLTLDVIRVTTAVKSGMLWFFLMGSTFIVATLLRANIRHLASGLVSDIKKLRSR